MHRQSDTVTVGEAAALLKVSTKTIQRMADSGKLPCEKTPGGQRRFRREDVEKLIPEE